MKTISAFTLAACLLAGAPAFAHMSHDHHTMMDQTDNDKRFVSNSGDDNSRKFWKDDDHRTETKIRHERIDRLLRRELALQQEITRLLNISDTGRLTMKLKNELARVILEIARLEMGTRTVS